MLHNCRKIVSLNMQHFKFNLNNFLQRYNFSVITKNDKLKYLKKKLNT